MGKWYLDLLPMIAALVGSYLKGRDSNTTGADDAVGNILVAIAPAVEGIKSGENTGKVRKAMLAIRNAADAYLAQTETEAKT